MEIVSFEPTSSGKSKDLSKENSNAAIDANNNLDNWTIRDQLMLISFAIVNGDSNWSYVCDQMNKFGQKKKTSAQCSKKYRQIINDFLNKTEKSEQKNQLIDLRKIYKEIADQRLEELNSSIKSLKNNYEQIVEKINELIYLENNGSTNEPLSSSLKYLITRWIGLNVDIGEETFQERYNQKLIDKIKLIEANKELNEHLISLLEKDDDFKRHEDELLRQAEQEAELERLRLQQEEEKVEMEKQKYQEQKKLEKQQQQKQQDEQQDHREQEQKEQEEKIDEELDEQVKKEQEDIDKVEIKTESHIEDENSKDSSKFSSEDDMPLLNIVKSKGLLIETIKTKSPSPLPSEKVRRSLRKGTVKTEEAGSPNHMSSSSSTVSTISHKSISLPCSSLSEQDKDQKNEVKASPSNTSSVYDNLDADDNHEVYKTKKKSQRLQKLSDNEQTTTGAGSMVSSGNLISIKQEPKDGQSEIETNKAANISGSSLSSVSSSKTSEDEKSHRAWKKSIMMILNNIACHKHATIFMHPVKDEIAPGYSTLIHRPIDLTTIKKNIETGITRTTKEFQRDIMLMFTNALMYNSTNHNIHRIALEMFKEVLTDIEQLLNAQETLCSADNLDSSVYSINKSLRYKEMRSSSTASDGKSSILSNANTSHDTQQDESLAGLFNNKKTHLTRDTKNNSKSSLKDESAANDTASIKSNSSVSTPRHSSTRSKNSSLAKLSQQKSPKTLTKKEDTNVSSKKRKQSVSSGTNSLNATLSPPSNNDQSKDREDNAPKSKRRKSGR